VSYTAREITLPAIWNFLEAVEDANPIYWDEETAGKSRFGRIIAPPQMLMAAGMGSWWVPPYIAQRQQKAIEEQGANPHAEVMAIVNKLGYNTATNVTREDEFIDVFGPGDGRLKSQSRVIDVSEEKQTRVGKGVFITTETEHRTEAGDRLVARTRNILLMYNPSEPRRD
jgi:acyl dehydratase